MGQDPCKIELTPAERWPALPVVGWQDTRDTVQLWTQMVGKTALALAPPLNHWWGVTLRVTASGLSTSGFMVAMAELGMFSMSMVTLYLDDGCRR